MNPWTKFWNWYENKILGSININCNNTIYSNSTYGMECRYYA